MTRVLCSLVAMCVLAGFALHGQQIESQLTNDPNLPLQIVSASVDGDGHLGPSKITLRAVGEKRIVAYVVQMTTTFNDGKHQNQEIVVDHRALGYSEPSKSTPAVNSVFDIPLHASTNRFYPAGVRPTGFGFRVLYTETVDGKVFGPEAEKYKDQLWMARTSRRNERDRLNKIQSSQGATGVVQELNKR